jgi:hypothetical protein
MTTRRRGHHDYVGGIVHSTLKLNTRSANLGLVGRGEGGGELALVHAHNRPHPAYAVKVIHWTTKSGVRFVGLVSRGNTH